MVNHDLVVYGVIVFSVTSNRQLNYRFHKLLVTDNDMMTANSSCTWLFVFLCCCIKGKLLLLFWGGWEHIDKTSLYCCCVAICHLHPDSCAHRNWESRPPEQTAVFEFICTGEGRQSRFWGVSLAAWLLTSSSSSWWLRTSSGWLALLHIYTASSRTITPIDAMSTSATGSGATGIILHSSFQQGILLDSCWLALST